MNYYPYYPTQFNGYQPAPVPQQIGGMIWVQGEAGAKAYSLRPGESAFLMDSEAPLAYLKRSDANGMPTMEYYKLEKITPENTPTATAEYATASDVTKLRDELTKLRKAVKAIRDSMEGQSDE